MALLHQPFIMSRAILGHDLGRIHTHTNKPPMAGVQLVGHTSITLLLLYLWSAIDVVAGIQRKLTRGWRTYSSDWRRATNRNTNSLRHCARNIKQRSTISRNSNSGQRLSKLLLVLRTVLNCSYLSGVKVWFYIALYPVRWTAQSALHFPPLADLFIPTPFSASLGSILAMQQLRNDYSLTFPPLSIARHSFIQLSRLRRREVKENAQTSKR